MQGEHQDRNWHGKPARRPAETLAQQAKAPRSDQGAAKPQPSGPRLRLKQVPEELVVYLVVVLHLGRFVEGSKGPRAPICRSTLQIGKARLHVGPQKLR